MIRLTCVVVVVLLDVFPPPAQDRGHLAIAEQGGRHAFSFRGEADAVNMCGTTACEVVASLSSCLGVAYSGPTQGQTVWTWLEAATEGDARVGAPAAVEVTPPRPVRQPEFGLPSWRTTGQTFRSPA